MLGNSAMNIFYTKYANSSSSLPFNSKTHPSNMIHGISPLKELYISLDEYSLMAPVSETSIPNP